MALIDLSNYAATLVPSTDSRAGVPNGNVYFDTTNGLMELIPVEELATFIVTDAAHPLYIDGTTPSPNP